MQIIKPPFQKWTGSTDNNANNRGFLFQSGPEADPFVLPPMMYPFHISFAFLESFAFNVWLSFYSLTQFLTSNARHFFHSHYLILHPFAFGDFTVRFHSETTFDTSLRANIFPRDTLISEPC